MLCLEKSPSLAVAIYDKHVGVKKASNPPATLLYPSPSLPFRFRGGVCLEPWVWIPWDWLLNGSSKNLLKASLLCSGWCWTLPPARGEEGTLALILRAPRVFRTSADPQICIQGSLSRKATWKFNLALRSDAAVLCASLRAVLSYHLCSSCIFSSLSQHILTKYLRLPQSGKGKWTTKTQPRRFSVFCSPP